MRHRKTRELSETYHKPKTKRLGLLVQCVALPHGVRSVLLYGVTKKYWARGGKLFFSPVTSTNRFCLLLSVPLTEGCPTPTTNAASPAPQQPKDLKLPLEKGQRRPQESSRARRQGSVSSNTRTPQHWHVWVLLPHSKGHQINPGFVFVIIKKGRKKAMWSDEIVPRCQKPVKSKQTQKSFISPFFIQIKGWGTTMWFFFYNINTAVKTVWVVHRTGEDHCQENYFAKSLVLHTHAKNL